MSEPEFKSWPKISRENPFNVTITEKINGTNGCIIIQEGKIVGVQSRKRFITPDDDNFGFARWVHDWEDDIISLGDGHHFGEWAGEGIQKNPHNLEGKQFFLFNTFRWNPANPNKPDCCNVVPVLYEGIILESTIPNILKELDVNAAQGVTPEGIIVYYHALRNYTKHTIISSNGKWCK